MPNAHNSTWAVKAMKLQRFWEPSPFPVELPAGVYLSVSEFKFTTRTGHPGCGRTCRTSRARSVTEGLRPAAGPLFAVTAEEAEQTGITYRRWPRLPDGLLVLMYRLTFSLQLDRVEREEAERPHRLGRRLAAYLPLFGLRWVLILQRVRSAWARRSARRDGGVELSAAASSAPRENFSANAGPMSLELIALGRSAPPASSSSALGRRRAAMSARRCR